MSSVLMSLSSFEAWPLVRLAGVLALVALLVLAALPLLVGGLLMVRLLVSVERAALVRALVVPGGAR